MAGILEGAVPFKPCTLKSVATTALGSERTPILHVPTSALLVCADCMVDWGEEGESVVMGYCRKEST